MAVLAIAGGTGGVGKTVVEQLSLHGAHHTVYILTREVDMTPLGSQRGHGDISLTLHHQIPPKPILEHARFLKVDYGHVDSLTKTLQDHKIDTVISTINLETDAGSQAQLVNLWRSSMKIHRDPNAAPGIGGWIPNARALKKTNLEYIRISIGLFSDYWGMPRIKSNLKPFQWLLDMDKGIVVVPGSGNEKFTVTYSEDLARVIVKLLDVDEKWPKRGFLSGSDISINEVIVTAEKIRGMSPIKSLSLHAEVI
ncbi:Isoflavone reductase like protein P3 [Purpureocillium lilacinum]|uniref:Isoflavone reductase like protein P3 n=1 Tax=Purpureocillium lilacinum TaxID=33203 RepID=A0A2U3EBL2_PURLI|nr:hypothetical protein Purlil1_12047 [Purpureocillium lilacinum]PWI71860.1 Isoflavone reductase like protein P3 [Purpureocillium lilacinum]